MTRVALLAAALLLHAATGHAHTLAGTTVTVTVPQPQMVIVTIEAEADPLIAKLEALAGGKASGPLVTIGARRARLESLSPVLRANIDARIDGVPVDLQLENVAVDDTAQVEVRLIAATPEEPRMFTWRSRFVFGAYRLAVASGSAGETVEWLQGPQTSTPIALEALHAAAESSTLRPIGDRIGHGLAMGALVVYVLLRCRGRSVRL